jgi:Ser/Thr protein kinase RdoA (MazF antagonist)
LVSHRDYATGNVVFRDGRPAALIDFDLARPTTRLYDIVNALWYWAPLKWGDPRDRAPALADADIPHRIAVFADAYGMTARQRAKPAPLAVDIAHRYREGSRASARLDPVLGRQWEAGGEDVLAHAEAWVRAMAPAIAARLGMNGWLPWPRSRSTAGSPRWPARSAPRRPLSRGNSAASNRTPAYHWWTGTAASWR